MLETVLPVVLASVLMSEGSSDRTRCRHNIDQGIRWTVDCSGMNLYVTPPPVILHPVVILNISNNAFVHLVESQFYNWTEILHLDMSSNQIEIVDTNTFKGLDNLFELNLMNNYIEFLSQNITNNLPKLRILNLSSNRLKEIRAGTFSPVPLLLKLYVKNNLELGKSLKYYDELEIALNQGLISLDISNISLTEISDSFFTNASHLISLNIAQNILTHIPELPFSLRNLNISGTLIETLTQGMFSKTELLEKLHLQGMPLLRDIKAKSLDGLGQLEELNIKNCPKLCFISEETFGESTPKLRRLVISDCALTTLSKTFVPLLERIVHLDLQNNPWVCDGRISWITRADISSNLTKDLRCDLPTVAHGQRLHDYFRPKRLHSHFTLIQGGIVIAMVAAFVASVVAMTRHMGKQKLKMYKQLQDIALQDRTSTELPSL